MKARMIDTFAERVTAGLIALLTSTKKQLANPDAATAKKLRDFKRALRAVMAALLALPEKHRRDKRAAELQGSLKARGRELCLHPGARDSRKEARKRRRLAKTLSTNGAITGEGNGSGNDSDHEYEVENHN